MNIAQIISSMAGGGRELDAVPLVKGFMEKGHNSVIFCRRGSYLDKKACREKLPVEYVKMSLHLDLPGILDLAALLRRRKINVIHAHWTRDMFNIILASRLAGGIPVVLTKHVFSTIVKKDPFHAWAFRNVAHVIAISDLVKYNLLETVPINARDITTIYNGIDAAIEWSPGRHKKTLRQELGETPDRKIISMIGRINEGKGQHLLVEAVARIAGKYPGLRVVFAGKSEGATERYYEAVLKKRIRSLGLPGTFKFLGYRFDIPSIIESSDVVAGCSVFESLGMTLIEGMAMGKAVIGPDTGAVPEIINDGVNGRMFRYGDTEGLAGILDEILSNEELCSRIGCEARRTALSKFNISSMVDRVETIFNAVVRDSQNGKLHGEAGFNSN